MLSFSELLTSGADERADILSRGTNKYHVSPHRDEQLLNRASCTCSPLTSAGYAAASRLYARLNSINYNHERKAQAERLKKAINYEGKDSFDICFAPSGSDLCYYPLLIASLLQPGRTIASIVTCPEELGSGSVIAFQGRYYASRNQFGGILPIGESIDGINVESFLFPARSEAGEIIDHTNAILEVIDEKHRSFSVCANLVVGSKSGIENNIAIISQSPENVLWTVDLCQFRASRKLINGLIGMNCCVMLTGSKFYQSPPFCAALLVPKAISKIISVAAPSAFTPYRKLLARNDVPETAWNAAKELPECENFGLLLRWEAALAEIELYAKLDDGEARRIIESWNKAICQKIEDSKAFELMPEQAKTNSSIVSFRVLDEHGSYLTMEKLKDLYEQICSPAGSERYLIGQPVAYSDKAFIRLAIGSEDVRLFSEKGLTMDADLCLLEKIQQLAWNRQ